jgi:dihydropteroate synthase
MTTTVAQAGAALVVMHMKGEPATMLQEAVYDDLVGEVKAFLVDRAHRACEAGIATVMVDPGIGFAKDLSQNLEVIRRLGEFTDPDFPLMVGPSRKRFIGTLTGREAHERLEGTLAAVTACVLNGADVVRVHDVAACKQAVLVADAVRRA